jgi:hypothetical protein
MKWVFSDGTVAHLGGEIEGTTYFAQLLRELVSQPSTVGIWAPPDGGVPLDLNDPALFDVAMRTEMSRPYIDWMMLSLIEAPSDLPPLPIRPRGPNDGDPRRIN